MPARPSLEAAVADALRTGLRALRADARVLARQRRPGDAEPLHRMRVALHRMRGTLRVYRKRLEKQAGAERYERASLALARISKALGRSRDWDVLALVLLPHQERPLTTALGLSGFRALEEKLATRRRRAHAAAGRLVASAGFAAALAQARRLAAALERDGHSRRRHAVRALEREQVKVVRLGHKLARLDADARHSLRIHCKRLRYATQAASAAVARRDAARWLRALERLQDALGTICDARLMSARLAAMDGPREARALEAVRRRTVRQALPGAIAAFTRWRRKRPPWR
jgi:CHAD domain-containing protein